MWRFYEMSEKEITNFGGIFFADGNLEIAAETMKTGRTVIMAMGTTMLGAMMTGLEAFSMTVMNICPEWISEMWEHAMNNRFKEAMVCQEKIVKRVRDIWTHDTDLIVRMKMEFNKVNSGIKMGPTRKPMWTETMMRHM